MSERVSTVRSAPASLAASTAQSAAVASPATMASTSVAANSRPVAPERKIQRPGRRRLPGGECCELFEHRQSIAQAAIGAVSDRLERFVVDGDVLAAGDLFHLLDHDRDGDPAKCIALATREDGYG